MQPGDEIDLYCYEKMSDIMQDVSLEVSKYRTILSHIPDSGLQIFCEYLNIAGADVATRADIEDEILGFRKNEHAQIDCSRVQRLLDDAGIDTDGSMQTMLNRLVSAYTRNIQILSEIKMYVEGRIGEHSQLFPHLKYDGIRLDNRFDVHIVNRVPTFNNFPNENVNSNNISASGVKSRGPSSLCSVSKEMLEKILDFLNIDMSMLTTRSELQAKVCSLPCGDLDRVFDDCGVPFQFDREIKLLMIEEIVAKNDILRRKMEAHAKNATQCKNSKLFTSLKYEGLNLVF
tara:strand:- start:6274 stop:7137 length:864 start_codon:yes stop_codon:yes gene_type:complete